MNDQPTPLTDAAFDLLLSAMTEHHKGKIYDEDLLARTLHCRDCSRGTERELEDAKAALAACREDSAELLAERGWWKDEVRAGYQRRYQETAENIVVADSILSPQ